MRVWRPLPAPVLALLLAGLAHGARADSGLLDFTPDEQAHIEQHGPWPPPPATDPGNRWSGQAQAVALGQRLFFDRRLSPDGRVACASCHQPGRACTGKLLHDRAMGEVYAVFDKRDAHG